MELTLNIVADVVMDAEELNAMLGDMSIRELEYLRSRIAATIARKSRGYVHADGTITTI